MKQCLTLDQMQYFLDLTGLAYTLAGKFLTLHAQAGDVLWILNGATVCFGVGVAA